MEDTCPNGHQVREGLKFCTACGSALSRRPTRASALTRPLIVVASVLLAAGIGVIGAKLFPERAPEWRSQETIPRSSFDESIQVVETTTSSVASTTTTTEAPPTTTTVAPTTTEAPVAVANESDEQVAHDAAVVFFTYGVDAAGYRAMDELMSPEGRPQMESQILGPHLRNSGCTQIVNAISLIESSPEARWYRFDLDLHVRCPEVTGMEDLYGPVESHEREQIVSMSVGPSPSGGSWVVNTDFS